MSRELILTASLTPHPILERIATKWDVLDHLQGGKKPDHVEILEEVRQDWSAFVADVKQRGILEPIKIVEIKGKPVIVDGRHRWKAALEAEISRVPCERVSIDQALAIMESTMIGRQHLTKGQRAYAAVVLHPEVATEGDKREKAGKAEPSALNAEGLATKFGVSVRLVEQACKLYRELDKSKTLRAKHEWRVFAGFGLGAILAGLAGDTATTDKPKPKAAINIVQPIASLRTFWQHYSKLGAEQRDVMIEHGQKTLSEGDPEFLDFLQELTDGAIRLKIEQSHDDEEDAS